MQRQNIWLVPLIIVVVVAAIYIDLPAGFSFLSWQHPTVHEGLDLQGGLQAVLEADVPPGTPIEAANLERAKSIVEQRVNGLGLTEPVVQLQGSNRIVVELPGAKDPQQIVNMLKQTGLLEFVYVPGGQVLAGDRLETDCSNPAEVDCGPALTTPITTTDASGAVVPAVRYDSVMSGVAIADATVGSDALGRVGVNFTLTPRGSEIFSAFTAQHINETLAIVVDKLVISAPTINDAITSGTGTISGNFTQATANQLALQLRYGALPVPLKVVQYREVGPSLGADSVRQSTIAGVIGLSVVALFMLLYYRLPGAVAVVALLIYAAITFALFKIIPVTLTLPGIAGFVLSVGVAVDANILIFERMKEELRGGKNIVHAVEAGFSRAWPSIRDSNISTLITCAILYWFGNTFGASIVKGFALTLALGVGVSLFTAIVIVRTILHSVLDRIDFSAKHSWFGI